MNKQNTIMFHITVSNIEDPDLFKMLQTLSGHHRAAKARALMRQGLHGPVVAASSMPIREQPRHSQQEGRPTKGQVTVENFDSLDLDIDELTRNLAASRNE
jgi:hypothetical protein